MGVACLNLPARCQFVGDFGFIAFGFCLDADVGPIHERVGREVVVLGVFFSPVLFMDFEVGEAGVARKSFTQNLRDFQVGHPILRGANLERTCYVPLSNSAYRLHLRHFSDHAGRMHGHPHDHTGGLWA